MKKFTTLLVAGAMIVSLAACGGKSDAEKAVSKAEAKVETTMKKADAKAKEMGTVKYSKADFMKACEMGMTEAQCNCYVDFYASIGLKVEDLGDQAKVTKAVTGLKPEQAMEMAKCMQ